MQTKTDPWKLTLQLIKRSVCRVQTGAVVRWRIPDFPEQCVAAKMDCQRLGEVEPTSSDRTGRPDGHGSKTAHDRCEEMDKTAIDTPRYPRDRATQGSRPPAGCPPAGAGSLRRVLHENRSARDAEQCEEQLRAIADEFFGGPPHPGAGKRARSALRRRMAIAASALVRHRPGGCGATAIGDRTARRCRSRRRTTARNTPVGRSGGGTLPPPVVQGNQRPVHAEAACDASRAVAARWREKQAQLCCDGIAWNRPAARLPIATLPGPTASSSTTACGLLGPRRPGLDGGASV